jgi:hypothetical protein
MKPIGKLGLAVLAAVVGMAILNAPLTMAETTALCKIDPGTEASEVCPSEYLQASIHLENLPGEKGKLLTKAGTVECDVMFLGKMGALGSPQVIKGGFHYTECGSCTVTEVSAFSTIKVLRSGHETASVTGEGEMHVVCPASINCYYSGVGLEGAAKGPLLSVEAGGEIKLSEQVVSKVKGLFCPSTAKLDLVLTTPTVPYITETGSGETALCDTDPGTGSSEVCPSKHLLAGVGQQTLSSQTAKLLTSSGTVECDVDFTGRTVGTSGTPLKIKGFFSYSNCGGCTVTQETATATIEVLKLGHETADVTGEGEIHVVCAEINCYYDGKGLKGVAKGPLLSAEVNGEVAISERRAASAAARSAGWPQGSFGLRQDWASRAARSSPRPSIGTRVCSSESRSLSVTVSSSIVWWSTVMPQGVPTSSWRR